MTQGSDGSGGGGGDLEAGFHALYEAFGRRAGGSALSLARWLERIEALRIGEALRDCGGNRSAAARALGIGRRTLYTKLQKLGLPPE